MKRQIGLPISIIVCISILVIPIALLIPERIRSTPKWYYYIEPGILMASEEIEIADITYTLETYMWRDFMPISPPDGKPLIVIIRVHAVGMDDFYLSMIIERLWLIDVLNIVSTQSSEEYRVNGNTFEIVFRDGPKWGPGIFIDVVVKLVSEDFGIYYLKAVNQLIHATW